MAKGDAVDPKGLIAEAYQIEGITASECRTIFLDWALSYDGLAAEGINALLARYGESSHPMTAVLQEGLSSPSIPRRRGGWRGKQARRVT